MSAWVCLLLLAQAPGDAPARDLPQARSQPSADYSPPAGFVTGPSHVPAPAPEVEPGLQRAEANAAEPIRLQPPQPREGSRLPAPAQGKQRSATSPITIVSSLAVVLGAFLILAWLARRKLPGAVGLLPPEALEVLGRRALVGKQQMYLIRCGSKLLLLNVTPHGAETLTEFTNPDDVEHLRLLCGNGKSGSATADFHRLIEELGQRETLAAADDPRARGRLVH